MNKKQCDVIWLIYDPRKVNVKDSYRKFSFQKPEIQKPLKISG